ncbi:MAG: Hsp20/alpha crystallin family protein, partial [Candidatus Heimdallarchaeota archaeon]|nr:Hsp20/alpha crystallin family protein [Candidatus Heimdallarchaeota archaeon]
GMSIGPDGIKNIPPEILEKMKNMGFPTGNMDFGNTNTNTVQEPYTEVNYDQYTNSYHIIADMPGIEENQVSISIDENEITISGNNGEMKYKKNLLVKHNLNKKSIDYKVRNGTLEIFVKAK